MFFACFPTPVAAIALALSVSVCLSCSRRPPALPATQAKGSEDSFVQARDAMVRFQIEARGVREAAVLRSMRTVPRHRFVPESHRSLAHEDCPLPIGCGQTISQPYMVAAMAEALHLKKGDRVLEVGSGSGYAAAVLAEIGAEVCGIELEQELCERSRATLKDLGYDRISLRCGDGFHGWPEKAPFDAILLSCSAEEIPKPLWQQLKLGGRLLYPKGPEGGVQELVLITKRPDGSAEVVGLGGVRFVPMRRP